MLLVDCNQLHRAGLRLQYLSARTDWLCSRLTDNRNKLAMSESTLDPELEQLDRQIWRLMEERDDLKKLSNGVVQAYELYLQCENGNKRAAEAAQKHSPERMRVQPMWLHEQSLVLLHQIARGTQAHCVISQQEAVRCFDRIIAELINTML